MIQAPQAPRTASARSRTWLKTGNGFQNIVGWGPEAPSDEAAHRRLFGSTWTSIQLEDL